MTLTDRQRQLAGLLLDGHDIAAIAQAMGVSRETLLGYLREMRSKLGARDNAALCERLVGMHRHPVDAVVERLRDRPRRWCDV
jgi:DNA-binding CsgD family transcriptional regulator